MKKYTLSKNGTELGPFNLEEVLQKITQREVELFDYVFDEQKNDWVLLTEHAEITQGLKANKPQGRPQKAVVEEVKTEQTQASEPAPLKLQKDPHGVEWFVLKGQSQFGPFTQHEMVRLMQEKSLFEFDFIWNSSMKDWKRLVEVEEFSKENIQSLLKNKTTKDSFFSRQYERTPFEGRVIVHNQNEMWVASGKEISQGGMGLYIADSMIVPGQVLNFHVKGHGDQETFNVKGEVVSKQFLKGARGKGQKIEYGVKFLTDKLSHKELSKAG